MNVEKPRHGDKIADVIAVKQEGDHDARRILDDPIRPFRIERCADLSF